jgi:hypothetical protein
MLARSMIVWLVVAALLLAAAALKAADRGGSVIALSGYGVPGRLAAPAWVALVVAEAALAAGMGAGVELAAYAAGGLLAVFMTVQLVALAQGGAGAPCGCFGRRGRLSRTSAARTGLLGAACAALPLAGSGPDLPLALTGAVAAGVVVLAAGRRAGAPAGALDVAGEGPPLGSLVPLGTGGEGISLALFTSAGCSLCKRVSGAADRLGVPVDRYEEHADDDAWAAAGVPGAPYAVALDPFGLVLAKGTVNDGTQLRSVLAAAEARVRAAAQVERPGADSSRRAFLGRAAAGVAGASLASGLVRPGEAEAYHFCGHIYTTDGCPHPTGLPRIDRRGLPLRAYDGRPVDDLGRLIDAAGHPVGEDGIRLTDLEGRPLPAAPRSGVCKAVGRDYRIKVRTDGAWYRCCGGRVRKLVDCCSPATERINGDASLKGYCYRNRKVFCVMYYQSSVPC